MKINVWKRMRGCLQCVKRIKKATRKFNLCKKPLPYCSTNNSFTNFVLINNKHNNTAPTTGADKEKRHEKDFIRFTHAHHESVLCFCPDEDGRNKV